MRVVALIQAHMTSVRFPGKVMVPIIEKPMLQRVIERVQQAKRVDEIAVLSDPTLKDQPIRFLCDRLHVPTFALSPMQPKDLLSLYMWGAKAMRADISVRITGDCPLIDASLIDACVALQEATHAPYVSTSGKGGFPDGLDVEVFPSSLLQYSSSSVTHEHVTTELRSAPRALHLGPGEIWKWESPPHWSVDVREDLMLMEAIYQRYGERFSWLDVCAFVTGGEQAS